MGRKRKVSAVPSGSVIPGSSIYDDPAWEPSIEEQFQADVHEAARRGIKIDFDALEKTGKVKLDLEARVAVLSMLMIWDANPLDADRELIAATKAAKKKAAGHATKLAVLLRQIEHSYATADIHKLGHPSFEPGEHVLSNDQVARAIAGIPRVVERSFRINEYLRQRQVGSEWHGYRSLARTYSSAGGTLSTAYDDAAGKRDSSFIRFVRTVIEALPDSQKRSKLLRSGNGLGEALDEFKRQQIAAAKHDDEGWDRHKQWADENPMLVGKIAQRVRRAIEIEREIALLNSKWSALVAEHDALQQEVDEGDVAPD